MRFLFCFDDDTYYKSGNMSYSIKQLKPNKKSGFKQGYFDVKNSVKYIGDRVCIYRSALELQFFNLMENHVDYLKWESEPNIVIKYLFPFKNKAGQIVMKEYEYNIDLMFEHRNGTKYLAEVKPFFQTVAPKNPNQPSYQKQLNTYERNVAKWTAAKKWASENGYSFCILTENFLR